MADVVVSARTLDARRRRFTSAPLSVDGAGSLPRRSIQRLARLGAAIGAPASRHKSPGLSIAAGRLAPTVRQAASREVLLVPFSVLSCAVPLKATMP
jgi:hypothetical protein